MLRNPPEIAPIQHPQRKEAITLVGRDALTQRFVFAIQPFHRDQQDVPGFESLMFDQFDGTPDNKYNATGLLDYLFPEVTSD